MPRRIVEPLLDSGVPLLAVCGNCDQPPVEDYFREIDIDLDRRARVIDGVRFIGLSGGLPFGDLPYERTEEDYERVAAEAFGNAATVEGRPTILVSHQPPFGTACDLAPPASTSASKSLRAAVERHQPDLVFSGHIHESIGAGTIGPTRVVNPGHLVSRAAPSSSKPTRSPAPSTSRSARRIDGALPRRCSVSARHFTRFARCRSGPPAGGGRRGGSHRTLTPFLPGGGAGVRFGRLRSDRDRLMGGHRQSLVP